MNINIYITPPISPRGKFYLSSYQASFGLNENYKETDLLELSPQSFLKEIENLPKHSISLSESGKVKINLPEEVKKQANVIYGIYNKQEKKWYVGQTSRFLYQRVQEHERRVNASQVHQGKKGLYIDLKNNPQDFTFCVLRQCSAEFNLDLREAEFIIKLNSVENGYNTTQYLKKLDPFLSSPEHIQKCIEQASFSSLFSIEAVVEFLENPNLENAEYSFVFSKKGGYKPEHRTFDESKGNNEDLGYIVYGIYDKKFDTWYIGKTMRGVEARLKGHINTGKYNKDSWQHNIIQRYNDFLVFILRRCSSIATLAQRETDIIRAARDHSIKLYNGNLGQGKIGLFHPHSVKIVNKYISLNNLDKNLVLPCHDINLEKRKNNFIYCYNLKSLRKINLNNLDNKKLDRASPFQFTDSSGPDNLDDLDCLEDLVPLQDDSFRSSQAKSNPTLSQAKSNLTSSRTKRSRVNDTFFDNLCHLF